MNEELIKKIGRILTIPPSKVEDMTFVKIIEALVHEFETPGKMNRSAYAPRSGVHFRDYQNICIVDRSTFYRRVRKGMDPISAATQPALPTRPYDKERRK